MSPGYVWTGKAKSVNVGVCFLNVTQIVVTSDEMDQIEAKYIDANGEEKTCNAANVLVTDTKNRAQWQNDCWYVVTNDVTLRKGAECSGNVKLILADGAKLEIDDPDNGAAGIKVCGDTTSLTIYGQKAGTGTLKVVGGLNAAGIGGDKTGDGHDITINGGVVDARGRNLAAAIGGGGLGGDGYNITINGGTVKANNGDFAAGIGGGSDGAGHDITIKGGKVTATGSNGGAAIGGGSDSTGSQNVHITAELVVKTKDSEYAKDYKVIEHDITKDLLTDSDFAGKQFVEAALPEIAYVDAAGKPQTANAHVVTSQTARVRWRTGWYAVTNNVTLSGGANCDGVVNLILADGAKLTAAGGETKYAGVGVCGAGDAFAVFGQADGTGALEAKGGSNGGAGIGGDFNKSAHDIAINGGNVSATGCSGASGIGGGCGAADMTKNIRFNGGKVKATGSGQSQSAPGVGGGDQTSATNIFAAADMFVKAGDTENPTDRIDHETNDLTAFKADFFKKYVTAEIPPTAEIPSAPQFVTNMTYAVYTNGVLSADGTVWSNRTAAVVVYQADKGWFFEDGSTFWTNRLDTTVSPAANKRGEVPDQLYKPTLKLGAVAQRYPWNGILDVEYKLESPFVTNLGMDIIVTANDVTATNAVDNIFEGTGKASFNAKEAFGPFAYTNVEVWVELKTGAVQPEP